jgi:transcriptional regulator with XRE-family HTH domain
MSEEIKKVAERLRALREIAGISLEKMAGNFGISADAYAAYEKGSTDMPISFLYEAASFFGIQVYELLSGEAPKLHVFQHVKKGRGLPIERSKQYEYEHLAYNFARHKVLPLLVTVTPEKTSELHTNTHAGQEFEYCLEGRVLMSVNGKEIVLEEGDSLFFDSTYPHGMKVLDDKPAKVLTIVI